MASASLERRDLGIGARPGLIVVDATLGFTRADSPLGCRCDDEVGKIKQLLDAFRAADLPRFFTAVIYRGADEARVFRRRLPALDTLAPDAQWVKLDPRLERSSEEPLIEKHWASAFFNTPLAELLKQNNADSLVVCGLTTSGCVRATAVDGLQHDYPVTVARDATADRDPRAHAANLYDLQAKYADVSDVGAIISALHGSGPGSP